MKKNDNLKTPAYIYRALGDIDLDPCAGKDTCIGMINYRLEDGKNGLELPWNGFVYCNPPFSQKEIWASKCIAHGNCILLLPERGSAPWFGPLVTRSTAHFVSGKKINFEGGSSSNNVGSVFFLFGQEAVRRIILSGLPGHLNYTPFFTPRNQPA